MKEQIKKIELSIREGVVFTNLNPDNMVYILDGQGGSCILLGNKGFKQEITTADGDAYGLHQRREIDPDKGEFKATVHIKDGFSKYAFQPPETENCEAVVTETDRVVIETNTTLLKTGQPWRPVLYAG